MISRSRHGSFSQANENQVSNRVSERSISLRKKYSQTFDQTDDENDIKNILPKSKELKTGENEMINPNNNLKFEIQNKGNIEDN